MKPKNLFLAAAIVFAPLLTISAQEVNWGIKAGANYSTLSANKGGETNYLLGSHAGIIAEVMINSQFAFQPELFYSMEGAKSSFSLNEEDMFLRGEQKIRLGYLQLPAMLKYFATDAFSIQAGPQLGYLLSGKNDFKFSSSYSGDDSGTEDIRKELRKITFGLNFGLGYEFQNDFFLQAGYYSALADIDSPREEPNEESDIDFPGIKNSSFQLSIGYKF